MINTPHTPRDAAGWLYHYGHGWNVKYQNLLNLDAGRVGKMNGEEQDAKQLVMSFQEMDINIARQHERVHRREYVPDGELDPITLEVMGYARCAMPDHAPPLTHSFSYGDADFDAAVASYQRWQEFLTAEGYGATGTGSWPVGCDPAWPQNHSVIVQIDTSGASADQKRKLADANKYTEACEAEIGQHVRHVWDQTPTPRAHHRVTFGPLWGSTIGYSYFPTPNTCNQTVTAKIDSTFDASAIALANLKTHEYKGHSDGLGHTWGGIMNPSLVVVNPLSWVRDTSYNRKKGYFGGVPISPREVTPDDFFTGA